MTSVERFTQRRIFILLVYVASYAVWQGAQLSYFAALPGMAITQFIAALVAGLMLFAVLLPFRDAAIRAAWSDERMTLNRMKACAAAFWAVTLAAASLFAVTHVMPLDARDAMRIMIIVVVAAPVIAFTALEGLDARE